MKLNKLKFLLLIFSFIISIASLSSFETVANAKSVSYKALRYGTNQTSMASGYFVRPATVTVKHHRYVVTMQIKTAKSLSSFPVAVNWVNGEKPQHVRKIKDRAGNSHYYYSFTTTNLRKKINAKLAIDVPKVYKAHHLITFKFNPTGLPRLGRSTASTAKVTVSKSHPQKAVKKKPVTRPSASKRTHVNKKKTTNSPSKQNSSAKAASPKKSSQSKKQSQQPKKLKQRASSSSKKPSSTVSSTPHQKAAPKSKSKGVHSKNHTPWIVSGVVAVVAVIGTGSWLIYRH